MDLRQAVAITAVAIVPFANGQEANNWKGETELGVLVTTGNTEETNIKGRLGLIREVETWRHTGDFSTNYSEAQDETTVEEYLAALETNYKFDKKTVLVSSRLLGGRPLLWLRFRIHSDDWLRKPSLAVRGSVFS